MTNLGMNQKSKWDLYIYILYIYIYIYLYISFMIIYIYNHKFNCDDRCLIYLLTCNQWRKQYVGQTVDSFRFRWNSYRCNCYEHAKGESVKQKHLYDHFMLEDHTQFANDVSVIFIDKTDPTDPLKREQYWRHTLKNWYHMALTFLKVYDCTIFVNYYMDWTVLGLRIWIRTRIWQTLTFFN